MRDFPRLTDRPGKARLGTSDTPVFEQEALDTAVLAQHQRQQSAKRQGHDEKAGEWDDDCNVPDGG